MKAHSIDKKTFQLTDDSQLLGELIYENLFFFNAEIKLAGFDVFKIKPVGIFQTSISVTKNGTEIATLVMNWRGEIVISYKDGLEYVLKLNKFFHGKYVIENRDKEKVIQLDPQFNWREFQYNYDIAYSITDDNNSKDPLLLLLGIYAANYFVACMSGANAGIM
jgi:hypothetical protein